ncbi:tetraacyldisaccharide 4'-kinase [soil metagenome]
MTDGAGSFASRLEAAWPKRGALATALTPLALVYRVLTGVRRWLYRVGIAKTESIDVPVLVVGNLIAGGAGKTPTVLACVASLRARGYTPGVISRGYRPGASSSGSSTVDSRPTADAPIEVTRESLASQVGDEPLLLRMRSSAPVFVSADRVAAARALRRAHPEVDVIVSDDGLQHLRLARDAAVIVFDERGVGNGWLLPAGPLREPLPRRIPARTIVLYNARAPSTPLDGTLASPSLLGAVSLEDWWSGASTATVPKLLALRGRKLLAAAGVARPERFFSMLESLALDIDRLPLPDHFAFPQGASAALSGAMPWPASAGDVLVTEKDAVKLPRQSPGATRIWVVALDFQPEPAFHEELRRLLPDRPSAPTNEPQD